MTRRTGIWIAALVVVSLAIGVFWTIRTAPPSPGTWWWGKNPDFHVEVWEPGKDPAKDMPTVGMTMPKKAIDAMFAFGLKSSVSVGKYKIYLSEIRSRVERLPRGQKLKIRNEEGATFHVWLDVKE